MNGVKINPTSLLRSKIPPYMHDGILLFYERGLPPGGFLGAVIDNDLRGAVLAADSTNRHLLFEYVEWFYNYAPARTWGFSGATQAWLKHFRSDDQCDS